MDGDAWYNAVTTAATESDVHLWGDESLAAYSGAGAGVYYMDYVSDGNYLTVTNGTIPGSEGGGAYGSRGTRAGGGGGGGAGYYNGSTDEILGGSGSGVAGFVMWRVAA